MPPFRLLCIYIAEVKRAKQEDDVYIFAAVQGRARRNASRIRSDNEIGITSLNDHCVIFHITLLGKWGYSQCA